MVEVTRLYTATEGEFSAESYDMNTFMLNCAKDGKKAWYLDIYQLRQLKNVIDRAVEDTCGEEGEE